MTVPFSAGKFDLCDWNSRAAHTSTTDDQPLFGGTDPISSYAAFPFDYYVVGAGLLLRASRPNQGSTRVGMRLDSFRSGSSIPRSFTLEFDLLPINIPASFEASAGRLFVGAANQQGFTGGVLISRAGLAYATSEHDTQAVVLDGTASVVRAAVASTAFITVRILIDGVNKRAQFYAALTEEAYREDAENSTWADTPSLSAVHNLPARSTVWGNGECVYVGAIAQAGTESRAAQPNAEPPSSTIEFGIGAIRLSSSALLPERKPTAVIRGTPRGVAGELIDVSGRESFDSGGRELTYHWELARPDGSRARLTGGTFASVSLLAADADDNLEVFYNTRTSAGNAWSFEILPASPFSTFQVGVLQAERVVRIQLAGDSLGATTTRMSDITFLFTAAAAASGVSLEPLFTADYTIEGAHGSSSPQPGTYRLSGGNGSADPSPRLLTDRPGTYTVSLRVFNGLLFSDTATRRVVVLPVSQLVGHRPNMDYLFGHLSDYWRLVDGTGPIKTFWSAIAQVASDQLSRLFQHDMAKSLADISRWYQRRWLSYKTRYTLESASVVRQGMLEEVGTPTFHGASADTSSRVSLPNLELAELRPADLVLVRSTGAPAHLARVARSHESGGAVLLTVNTPVFTRYTEVASGTACTVSLSDLSLVRVGQAGLRAVVPGDVLRAFSAERVVAHADPDAGTILLASALPEAAASLQSHWVVVRPSAQLSVSRAPYVKIETALPCSLVIGDVLLCTADIPGVADGVPLALNVVAALTTAGTTFVWVDWSQAAASAGLLTAAAGMRQPSVAEVASWVRSVDVAIKTRALEPVKDLRSIPFLGSTPSTQDYAENADYVVEDDSIRFSSWVEGEFRPVGADSLEFTLQRYTPPFREDGYQSADLSSLKAYTLVVDRGPVGVYTVKGVRGHVWEVSPPLPLSGGGRAFVPRFNALNAPAEDLWAELSLFDNADAIGSRFGVLVGLPRSLLTGNNLQFDYLAAVRSMWFAMYHTPSVKNIRVAAQALFNIPFAEAAGTVEAIIEPLEPDDLGTIAIRVDDPDAEDPTQREASGDLVTYPYRFGWALARVGDRDLQAGDRVNVNDALFRVIDVFDYINDPTLMSSLLPGQERLRQYHTFGVRVPLDVVGDSAAFVVLQDFLRRVKDARTDFIAFGQISIAAEEISVLDEVDRAVGLRLQDTIHTTPFRCPGNTPYVGSAYTHPVYPLERTLERGWVARDAWDKYRAGYAAGVYNDVGGHGSFNLVRRETDPVNHFNSDIDTLSSFVWVPVTFLTAGLIVGEEVLLKDGAGAEPSLEGWYDRWTACRPVVVHIGCGEHPMLPGVVHPQTVHPNSYVVLGFDLDTRVSGYGEESVLDALSKAEVYGCRLVGATTGGVALPAVYPARNTHPHLYFLEKIFRHDLLEDTNPRIVAVASPSIFIPLGGATVGEVRSTLLSGEAPADLRFGRQLQQYPYDASVADNAQFVPSFGPGYYTLWDGAGPLDPATWDYTDVGPIAATPTDIDKFTVPPAAAVLRNVHLMARTKTLPEPLHRTHGFVRFEEPDPVPLYVPFVDITAGMFYLFGWYFIAPDPTADAEALVFNDPTSFTGQYGGSWVFLENAANGNVARCTFVELVEGVGEAGWPDWVPVDRSVQSRSGHVLRCASAVGPGLYHVHVVHYRPYADNGNVLGPGRKINERVASLWNGLQLGDMAENVGSMGSSAIDPDRSDFGDLDDALALKEP